MELGCARDSHETALRRKDTLQEGRERSEILECVKVVTYTNAETGVQRELHLRRARVLPVLRAALEVYTRRRLPSWAWSMAIWTSTVPSSPQALASSSMVTVMLSQSGPEVTPAKFGRVRPARA